ncbi:sugar phosphate isomerase/epimerase family protein [Microbacterium trichothecenolyticum]|jgi:D-psicose/D-tagatose/L-ribulose 3-epimerase
MDIGCHALVWTGQFDSRGVRVAAEKTKTAGFDLIEYPLMDPFTFDTVAARSALAEYDLKASASLGLSEATDVTSSDPAVVEAGEALLIRAVDVVADLGGKHLCGVIYSAMRKYMEPVSARGLENSKRTIGRVADHAADRGVNIALEVVNRYETNVLNTARQAIMYLAEVDRPNLGVHLDTYHMNIEESDMFSPVLDAATSLQYVHVGESHRGYLGTGSVDFDVFFKALHRISYRGPITFESFSSAVVAPDLSRMLGIWRTLWTDNDDLGAHASAYIRDKIKAIDTIRLH